MELNHAALQAKKAVVRRELEAGKFRVAEAIDLLSLSNNARAPASLPAMSALLRLTAIKPAPKFSFPTVDGKSNGNKESSSTIVANFAATLPYRIEPVHVRASLSIIFRFPHGPPCAASR